MFRCGLAILLCCLVLSAGAGAHPLLLTNEISSSIAPRDSSCRNLHFFSDFRGAGEFITTVTKFPTQGEKSWMGTINGGLWSCPACTPPDLAREYPALAKEHTLYLDHITEERIGLQMVGQALDYGKDASGKHWTIVRDMRVTPLNHGSRDLLHNIIHRQLHMTRSVCEDHYQKAYDAALERMKWYVEHRSILHRDVTTFNALLNDTLGDVELVDWGRWIYRKVLAEPLLHF